VGCLLAILLEHDETAAFFSGWLRNPWLTAVPALALTLLAIFQVDNPPLRLALWSAQPLIIAVLLVQFVYWGSKSWKILGSAPVSFLAHISYALYLYHPLASGIIFWYVRRHVGFYGAALALAMATASYYLLEKPFMKLRDRKTPHAPATAPAQ
jgi:peptidoglycan/LPS O-acetylase OafA/YrhL